MASLHNRRTDSAKVLEPSRRGNHLRLARRILLTDWHFPVHHVLPPLFSTRPVRRCVTNRLTLCLARLKCCCSPTSELRDLLMTDLTAAACLFAYQVIDLSGVQYRFATSQFICIAKLVEIAKKSGQGWCVVGNTLNVEYKPDGHKKTHNIDQIALEHFQTSRAPYTTLVL